MTKFPKIPAELIALTDMGLQRAACVGKAPLFDADVYGETNTYREYRRHQARQLCRACPIVDRCQSAFDELPKAQQQGVWAGRLHPEHTTTRTNRKKAA